MIGIGLPAPGGFLQVASKSTGAAMEPKICEGWRCGKMFFRRTPHDVRHGETLCAVCRRKEDQRRAATMERRRR